MSVSKEPIAPRQEPPLDRSFPCESCGAKMTFEPGTTSLVCPYCGSEKPIPQTAHDVRELSYHAYFQSAKVPTEVLEGTVCEVKCTNCGAIVEIPANLSTDNCTFCGAHLDNPVETPVPTIKPASLLPFLIEYNEARTKFDDWLKSRWFAPNKLKKMARLGRLSGLYVPYWTYDSMTFSFYTGMRGEHYWETVKDSNGNSRRVMKTRWYPASGRVNHFFDDVLVCGSRGLPDNYARALEPWDLNNLKDVSPQFLAGFRTERYQVSAEDGFESAKGLMAQEIDRLVRRDIGGDAQQVHSVDTQYDGITFKHILLPVWLAAYQYHGKSYRILINARTGEVQGNRPYSWIKITLFVIAMLMLAGLIALIVGNR